MLLVVIKELNKLRLGLLYALKYERSGDIHSIRRKWRMRACEMDVNIRTVLGHLKDNR